MHAYVIKTGLRISPFDDKVTDMPVGGVSLEVWQKEILQSLGFSIKKVERMEEIPSGENRLVTYDNVFFSRRGLKSFLSRWKKSQNKAARFAIPNETSFTKTFSDLQEPVIEDDQRVYNIWLLGAESSVNQAKPLEITYREHIVRLPVPPSITGFPEWEHPVTSSVGLHVTHWLHVLQINLLSIQIRWVDNISRHWFWGAWVLFKSLWGHPSRFRGRVGQYANRIGKNVKIHPTAVVEGSIIGDNVEIGPQALVRGAIISDGAVIQERVNVAFSVIGPKSFISKHSVVHACASFEQADLCMRGMQLCLVGRKAALTTRATPIDIAPGKKIKVLVNQDYVPINMPMLGTCFGHEVFIGADVYIGPGRQIPNGIRIISDTGKILARIPDSLESGKTYAVKNSSLEAVDASLKE